MRDKDVRCALYRELEDQHASELSNTRFVDELGLCGEVRVDVAVLNGALSGYELKSAADTLQRLPKQVEYYSKVLDFAVLVVADNHAEAAAELLPKWWGLTLAVAAGEQVALTVTRAPQRNPDIDAYSLALLLWRDEALSALAERQLDKGVRSKSRSLICQRLADTLPIEELRDLVREQLKARADWRSALRR
jgi:hypothetical protein